MPTSLIIVTAALLFSSLTATQVFVRTVRHIVWRRRLPGDEMLPSLLLLALLALPACKREARDVPPPPRYSNNVADYSRGPGGYPPQTVDSDAEGAKQWLRERGYIDKDK